MPSPELLSKRVVEAVQEQDESALRRWLKHPRFDSEHPENANALFASFHTPNAPVWLEILLGAGVPLRKMSSGSEAIHEAARLANVEAVRWLLDKGVPANACTVYGFTMLNGVLNRIDGPLPEHDNLVRLLWERTQSIQDMFGWQTRHLKEFVQRSPSSWVVVLLEGGWDPKARKKDEASFWETYLEKEQAPSTFRAVFEQWRLDQRMPQVSPAPSSGSKPRL